MHAAIMVALGVLAVGCAGPVDDGDVDLIDAPKAHARLNDQSLVVDTRSQKEYDQGHIPGAQLVKIADVDLQSEQPRFPGYSMILVYGQNPGTGAAMAMAKRLIITKHDNVRLLDGGFEQWTREGLPVEISRPNPNDAPVE